MTEAPASSTYGGYSFERRDSLFRDSALAILPLILDVVHPRSVIDVGCGLGVWLSVLKSMGVPDILGIERPGYDREKILVPQENIALMDLREPLRLSRKFDLTLSLEVAEHLPPDRASSFIDDLTGLSPVIAFSAAIPLQGGPGHLNEQWPDYWISLFDQSGYEAFDIIRPAIWRNDEVKFWYRQNLLLFIDRTCIAKFPSLSNLPKPLPLVHPAAYLRKCEELERMIRITDMRLWKRLQKTTFLLERISRRLKRGFAWKNRKTPR